MNEAQDQSEELTIDEIYKKYANKWVAIIVTERDKNLQPIKGKVVAVELDRYRLWQQTQEYNDLCIFYAGDPIYPLML